MTTGALPRDEVNDTSNSISLMPGDIKCSQRAQTLTTVLGSCVAVCLWDVRRGIGGMNHFVLPKGPPGEKNTRYGDVAVEELISRLRRLGCDPSSLQAKLFGGAAVLPFFCEMPIGTTNVELAVAQLDRHKIPIVAQRTGGTAGQHIRFRTGTGEVFLRYVTPTMQPAKRARSH